MSRKLEVLRALIAAWKAGDIEGVLGHLHEDVVWHYAAAVAPPARGKAKARKFLETFRPQLGEVRWRLVDFAETGERLFVEGVEDYTQTDGAVVVDARFPIEELEERFGIVVERDKFDTVAGLIFHLIGRIPKPGDEIAYGALLMTIVDADERKIRKVRIIEQHEPSEAATV